MPTLAKRKKPQINNLSSHLKDLEKEEQRRTKQIEGNNKDKSGNQWN